MAPSEFTGIATGTVGAIQELRVSVDLLARGYEVFRAVSPSCSCDLAILKDGRLLKIEVRTARRRADGKMVSFNVKGKYDVLAIVVNGEIIYRPEVF